MRNGMIYIFMWGKHIDRMIITVTCYDPLGIKKKILQTQRNKCLTPSHLEYYFPRFELLVQLREGSTCKRVSLSPLENPSFGLMGYIF